MGENRIQPHNEKPAASWASAGQAYEKFSEDLGEAISRCIDYLDPQPEECVLDVATGTGWGARLIAARGAEVHGIDFGNDLIDAAQMLAAEAELDIQFSTADAEELPFDDASFDVVISTFGVMFVQRPEAAAGELARVCRPDGRLGLTTWPPDGTIAALVKDVMVPYRTPPPDPPPPSPYLWGKTDRVTELLGSSFDLQFETECTVLRESSGADVWRMWSQSHGLTVTMLEKLSPDRRLDFERDFVAFHEKFRTDSGIAMPRDYLVTLGVRK